MRSDCARSPSLELARFATGNGGQTSEGRCWVLRETEGLQCDGDLAFFIVGEDQTFGRRVRMVALLDSPCIRSMIVKVIIDRDVGVLVLV